MSEIHKLLYKLQQANRVSDADLSIDLSQLSDSIQGRTVSCNTEFSLLSKVDLEGFVFFGFVRCRLRMEHIKLELRN